MEAKKYFEEKVRMFDSLRTKHNETKGCSGVDCEDCPLESNIGECLNDLIDSVDIVEKWSQEHPKQTMLVDLLEKYPNTILSKRSGMPEFVCPHHLGYDESNYCMGRESGSCIDCWNREYE